MLQRIDSDSAEYLVILYDPTDYHENQKFNEGRGTLETMNKAAYDNVVHDYLREQLYYPGKYTNALVGPLLFEQLPRTYVPPITPDDHAREFIEVLINGKSRVDECETDRDRQNRRFHQRATQQLAIQRLP